MLSKKEFTLSFEQVDKAVKLYLGSDKSIWYLAVAELVLVDNRDEHTDRVLNALSVLSDRSIKSGFVYLLLTCIGPRGPSTKVGILYKDLDKSLRELEIVCSLIETLSHGMIKCIPVESVSSAFKQCLESLTPVNFLRGIISRKLLEVEDCHIIPHPLSVVPLPNIYTAREFQHLSSTLSRGSIPIGYLYSNPNIIITFNDDHILRHIAIVGSTGSGKSTTASIIAEKAAERGYAVVVVDWHGEYESLLKHDRELVIYTNPLKGTMLEPLNLEELIKREPLSFIEILESSLGLTPAQAHILEDAVNILAQRFSGGGYCIDVIIDVIQNSSATARWFTESREALLRKLKPLSSVYLNIYWNKLKRISIENRRIHVFDTSAIPNIRVRKIISSLLIRSIVLKAQYNNIAKPILLIVDEAHNIFYTESPLSTLVAEVRKWGVGFTIVTQAPSMLSPIVIKNTNTKIVHALKSSNDIKTVISAIALKKEHKKIISALKPGEALLVVPELAEPVLIEIARI